MPDPRADRAERLLRAAAGVFAARGYPETKVHHITEAADVGVGTFYLHFSSKHEVLMALVRAWGERLLDVLRRDREAPAGDGGYHGCLEMLRLFADHRELARTVLQAEGIDPEVTAEIRRIRREAVALTQATLERQVAQGVLLSSPPEVAASACVGMVERVAIDWILTPETPPMPLERIAEQLCALQGGALGIAPPWGGEPIEPKPNVKSK